MGKKKKKIGTISSLFYSKMFLGILLVVIIIVTFGYTRAFYQDYKIKQEIAALQAEIKSLEKNKIESLGILNYVMSDAYVEEKARTSLNMKAPGERVLLLPEMATGSDPIQDEVLYTDNKHLNNPTKWWYYFTHRELPDIYK